MPRIARQLSVKAVSSLAKKPGRWPVGGTPGLYLRVSDALYASWILRAVVAGRRRDIGLGSYRQVDLGTARRNAHALREQIDKGVDVVHERRAARAAQRSQQARRTVTFDEAAKRCHAVKAAEFRSAKFKKDWLSAVTRFASPTIGKIDVADIEVQHIVSVLQPIWGTRTDTASRLRGRLENILDWATVAGYRKGENPARWKGNLEHLLPRPSKTRKVVHHRALPWQEVPECVFRTNLTADSD